MKNLLNQNIVLVINRNYQILGVTCPQKAFVSMCSLADGENLAAKAVIIDYEKDQEGNFILDYVTNIQPVFWDEWIKQEVRPCDNYISTPKIRIRIPTVLQAHNYSKMGFRTLKPNNVNLVRRYGNKCAYTDKILSKRNLTKDHVIPISRWKELGKSGDVHGWENVVLCDKSLNHKKGNSLNEEIGLQLRIKPTTPAPIPISELIKEIRSSDWKIFFHK